MLDIKKIRENPKEVEYALSKRAYHFDTAKILDMDSERRVLISSLGDMKNCQNTTSKKIPIMVKKGEDITNLRKEMGILGREIGEVEDKIQELDSKIKAILIELPNIPAEEVVGGGKENNQVLCYWGEKPKYDFDIKNHVQLSKDLSLVDYNRGVKIAGEGTWIYTGVGACLEWALLNFFIQEHIKDGYAFILPPHMLNYDCGYVAGQFPKYEDEDYWIEDKSDEKKRFLLPTAETALVSLHRDETLLEKDLPKKYFSYTPCFRREAGSDRMEERGMIRGHQFNKVEMVHFALPADSEHSFSELCEKAERLVRKLGLHYRLSKLAAKDCSYAMGKTFDIEVYIPSMNIYKEVSSISHGYDYQARRGNMKYKNGAGKKEFMHTLNASGLATSRIMPALLETYQQEDGTVVVPEVLRPLLGMDVIGK